LNYSNDNQRNNSKFDLVIIGTGTAASTMAHECASQDWKIAIIESWPSGGTCALRGCDPKKVLIAAEEALFGTQK
jgi:glutathione reductase (NADPH)